MLIVTGRGRSPRPSRSRIIVGCGDRRYCWTDDQATAAGEHDALRQSLKPEGSPPPVLPDGPRAVTQKEDNTE